MRKYFSSSCAHVTALTPRWMFSFHSELSLTSLYLLCCDPGAGSSSHTSTLRAGYCRPESISPPLLLIYTCLFLSVFLYSPFFMPTVLRPLLFLATLSVAKPALCVLIVVALVSPHKPVSLGEFCLQVTGWSWFLEKCFRLMLDGSVKLAIISTAWIETQEQKHHFGMLEILSIHMVWE